MILILGLTRDDLAIIARSYQAYAWASSTQKSLNSEQKAFFQFAREYNVTSFPVSGDDLVIFATFLVHTGRVTSVGSLRQYLSPVSTLHKMYGERCDTPSTHGPLGFTVKGFERCLAKPIKRVLPITIPILKGLLAGPVFPHAPSWADQVLVRTLHALYIILFTSMLRCGNLLPSIMDERDPRRHLSWGRVETHQDGMILNIVLSKTIQFSERVHQVPLAPCPNKKLCPVTALTDLMAIRGVDNCSPNSLVFAVPTARGWEPLLKPAVVKIFNRQLVEMGLDPTDYSMHSFRHGGLQEALLANVSLDLLKIHSDHHSGAVFSYLNLSGSRRFQVSKILANRLRNS